MAQPIKADLDEMVFEDRERRYGAYYLRKNYGKHLAIAVTGICLLFFLGFIVIPTLGKNKKDDDKRKISAEIELADLPEPPPLDEEKPPPPPPEVDIPPPQLKTVAFKIPEPTPKDELPEEEEKVTDIKELEDAPNIGLENVEGADEGFIDIPDEGDGDVPAVIVDDEPDIDAFVFDAEEPQPRNLDDVRKKIGYPDIAKDAGIEGSVVIRVLVDKYGNYRKHKVIKKAHPILAEACEKHIADLKFTPAIQGGKPIPFWVNIPFKFQLLN